MELMFRKKYDVICLSWYQKCSAVARGGAGGGLGPPNNYGDGKKNVLIEEFPY